MKKMLLIASLILAAVACQVESAHPWDPNWGGGGETPVDPEKKPEAKPRYVWIDAAAMSQPAAMAETGRSSWK